MEVFISYYPKEIRFQTVSLWAISHIPGGEFRTERGQATSSRTSDGTKESEIVRRKERRMVDTQ